MLFTCLKPASVLQNPCFKPSGFEWFSPVGFCSGDPVLWMPFWVKLWCVVDRVSTLVFLFAMDRTGIFVTVLLAVFKPVFASLVSIGRQPSYNW